MKGNDELGAQPLQFLHLSQLSRRTREETLAMPDTIQ